MVVGKVLGRREFGEPNTGVTDNYVLGGMHLTKVLELIWDNITLVSASVPSQRLAEGDDSYRKR